LKFNFNSNFRTKNPTRHAEFVAIDQASDWCCENGKEFQEVI